MRPVEVMPLGQTVAYVADINGFLGGMTADKYAKITGASKATATRYAVNVPAWVQPAVQG